eukprot:jgi/Chrzof1/11899/Cz06g13300.t1
MSDPMVRVFTLIPVPVPVVIPLPQLLTYALTCNVLDLDSVTVHISQMKSVLGKAAMVPILQDIMDRIGDNEAPSPPKYHAPSVMQPELRHFLVAGYHLPLPPPPPATKSSSSSSTTTIAVTPNDPAPANGHDEALDNVCGWQQEASDAWAADPQHIDQHPWSPVMGVAGDDDDDIDDDADDEDTYQQQQGRPTGWDDAHAADTAANGSAAATASIPASSIFLPPSIPVPVPVPTPVVHAASAANKANEAQPASMGYISTPMAMGISIPIPIPVPQPVPANNTSTTAGVPAAAAAATAAATASLPTHVPIPVPMPLPVPSALQQPAAVPGMMTHFSRAVTTAAAPIPTPATTAAAASPGGIGGQQLPQPWHVWSSQSPAVVPGRHSAAGVAVLPHQPHQGGHALMQPFMNMGGVHPPSMQGGILPQMHAQQMQQPQRHQMQQHQMQHQLPRPQQQPQQQLQPQHMQPHIQQQQQQQPGQRQQQPPPAQLPHAVPHHATGGHTGGTQVQQQVHQHPPMQQQTVRLAGALQQETALRGAGGGRQPPSAPVQAPAATADSGWWCSVCTYHHTGPQAEFLMCAICGCEKGA